MDRLWNSWRNGVWLRLTWPSSASKRAFSIRPSSETNTNGSPINTNRCSSSSGTRPARWTALCDHSAKTIKSKRTKADRIRKAEAVPVRRIRRWATSSPNGHPTCHLVRNWYNFRAIERFWRIPHRCCNPSCADDFVQRTRSQVHLPASVHVATSGRSSGIRFERIGLLPAGINVFVVVAKLHRLHTRHPNGTGCGMRPSQTQKQICRGIINSLFLILCYVIS